MEVFSKHIQEDFVNRMVSHLNEFYPKKCQEMGPQALRQSIYDAIDRCREAGIETEYDVARYIDLIYELGWPTEDAPVPFWTQEVLDDPELDGSTKIDRLLEKAKLITNVQLYPPAGFLGTSLNFLIFGMKNRMPR
jgi:hypothetical protein